MKKTIKLKISLFIGLIFIISSCSVIKKITKKEEKHEAETEEKAQENTLTKTETDGKSKTTITEEVDTTARIGGSELKGSTRFKAGTVWTLEDAAQSVTITTDSAGKSAVVTKVKPRDVPIRKKKTTVKEEAVKQTITQKSDSSGTKKTRTKDEASLTDRDVKKWTLIPWWIWLIILVAGLGYYFFRRYRAIIKSKFKI